MARIHTIADAIIKDVRKRVYAVTPAAVDGKGENWQAHLKEAGNILTAGETVRLFDVMVDNGRAVEVLSEGCKLKDYALPMMIAIVYGTHDDYNMLMASDFAAIYHALHNADVSTVAGLQLYMVDAPPVIQQTEKTRAMVISFTARLTAE